MSTQGTFNLIAPDYEDLAYPLPHFYQLMVATVDYPIEAVIMTLSNKLDDEEINTLIEDVGPIISIAGMMFFLQQNYPKRVTVTTEAVEDSTTRLVSLLTLEWAKRKGYIEYRLKDITDISGIWIKLSPSGLDLLCNPPEHPSFPESILFGFLKNTRKRLMEKKLI